MSAEPPQSSLQALKIDEKSQEEAFSSLLATIEKDKSRRWDLNKPQDSEVLDPLLTTIDHYAEHGDRASYDKIVRILNCFIDPDLEAALDKNISGTQFGEILEINKKYLAQFSLLDVLAKAIRSKTDRYKVQNAYHNLCDFMDENGITLSQEDKDLLKPLDLNKNSNDHHIHGHPKGQNSERLSTLPYREMVEAICQKAIEKKGSDFKLDTEKQQKLDQLKKDLVLESHKYETLSGLDFLLRFYRELDFHHLLKNPHLIYFINLAVGNIWFYDNTALKDILPHSVFKKLLPHSYKFLFSMEPDAFMILMMGKWIIEENPDYAGWTLIPKTVGMEPGFVLRSPDKKYMHYVKHTPDMYQEYFCAKVLAQMGLKMAEARLLTDNLGNAFFLTQSLTRNYSKGEQLKSKTFKAFDDIISSSALEERQQQMDAFVATHFDAEKTRVSFAKLLLVEAAFGLYDVVTHGGNFGALITTIAGRENMPVKFGVVDFGFKPTDGGFMDAHETNFFVKRIRKKLKNQDFLKAASELEHFKVRNFTPQGFLVQSARERTLNFKAIIENVAAEIKTELQNILPEKEYKEFCATLDKNMGLMINNLTQVINTIKSKENAPESPEEQKANADKPKK